MELQRMGVGAALAIGLVTSGCATRRQAGMALTIEASTFLFGGVTVASASDETYDGLPTPEKLAGYGIMGIAVAAAVVTLLTMPPSSSEPEPEPALAPRTPDPAAALRAAARDHAWDLTKRAAAAARAGDCTTVVQLDATVKQRDADFHAVVFVRDAAIARCLAARATP